MYLFMKLMDKVLIIESQGNKDPDLNTSLSRRTDNVIKNNMGLHLMGRNSKFLAEVTVTCIAFSNSLLHAI